MESLRNPQEGSPLEEQRRRGEAHVRHIQDPEQGIEVLAEPALRFDVHGQTEVQVSRCRGQRPIANKVPEVVVLPQVGRVVVDVRRIGHGRNRAILAPDPEAAVDLERADGRSCPEASNGHPPTDPRDRSVMLEVSRTDKHIGDLDSRTSNRLLDFGVHPHQPRSAAGG